MIIKWIFFFFLSFSLLHASSYTLEQLCKKGIESNPKIKSFSYKTSASNSYYDQSIDQYKPHFSIDGQLAQQNYTLSYTSGEQNFIGLNHQYQLSLKQPVYRAKLLRAMDDAKQRIVLSELIEKDEKAKLITQILQNAFELVRLDKTIHILTQKEQILKKAYSNIEKKHKVKLASKVDQYQSLSMLKQSHSSLIIAKQRYDQVLFNLRMLTKINDVEKYIKTLDFNMHSIKRSFGKVDVQKLKTQYLQNTRIKLEQQTVKIAKEQIGLRNTERAPNVDLVLSYGDSGGTLDATVRQNDSRAMLTLNFPIYQGGYVDDRVEEARFLALSAQENAENTTMNIKISLEKKIQEIRSGLESVKAEETAVSASKKYFEATVTSYQNGLGSLTDAYLAEADHYDSKLRLIDSQANIFNALAEIYYYIGIADYRHVRKLQKKYFR